MGDTACHDIALALQNMRERWGEAQQSNFEETTALIERQAAQIEVLMDSFRETQKKNSDLESRVANINDRMDELTGTLEDEKKRKVFTRIG